MSNLRPQFPQFTIYHIAFTCSHHVKTTKGDYLGYIRLLHSFQTCATTCPCIRHSLLKSCQRGQNVLQVCKASKPMTYLPPVLCYKCMLDLAR
ncbi:hypothetical protein EYC80_004137 [Monilinia laxa]|uniref:Uncharacterized protein n=1 Tax=Monilinia laxa TaxID=61186 RepID=A0A5N6KM92_MONLA|nr:hypothetical protein EYC80_004137 [Monilinia laxa]